MGFFGQKKAGSSLPIDPAFVTRKSSGNSFFTKPRVTHGRPPGSALAGHAGLAPWNAQALAPFPQALAADAEFARQLSLGHVVLVLEDEMLEVVFQRQV